MLKIAVKGIVDTVFGLGLINLDYCEMKNFLSEAGIIGFTFAVAEEGVNMIGTVIEKILNSPLLEGYSTNITQTCINIVTSSEMELMEITELVKLINKTRLKCEGEPMFSYINDENLKDKIEVTIFVSCSKNRKVRKVNSKIIDMEKFLKRLSDGEN